MQKQRITQMPTTCANQRLHKHVNCLCKYVPTKPSRDHVDKIWRNRNAQNSRTNSNPSAWTKLTEIMKKKIQNFMKMNQIKTTFSQTEKLNSLYLIIDGRASRGCPENHLRGNWNPNTVRMTPTDTETNRREFNEPCRRPEGEVQGHQLVKSLSILNWH